MMAYSLRITWLALLAVLLSGSVYAEDAPARLPTIRPLWLDTKETPTALGAGSWSIIPYAEFHKTWQKAKQVADTGRLPWLIESHYYAVLEGLRLSGTAELLLHNPHQLPAWGRLRPWSMPLVQLQNDADQKIRADETGKGLLALTPPASTKPLTLHWEATGEERQGGKWFALQLPACPLATLSLILPSPLRVEWPAARQHVSGPHPLPGGFLQRWDLHLGGQARQEVQFVIRNRRDTTIDLSLETKLDADFIVGTGEVQARYELDVQRWHDRLRFLTLELSQPMQLKTLQLKQLDSVTHLTWQMVSSTLVRVTLPETVELRASLLLEASAKTSSGERLAFPVLTVRGATNARTTMRVAWDSSQQLTEWNWGDFAPQPVSRGTRFQASAEIVTLVPHVVAGIKPLLAPSARLIERSLERTYAHDQWWQVGKASQLHMQCQTQLKPRVTEIFSWQVPAGWKVTEVLCDPPVALLAWTALPGKPFEVQLEGVDGKVTVQATLVPEQPMAITEEPRTLFMPMLKPLSPGRWSGQYAITVDRGLLPASFNIIQAPGTPATLPTTTTGLWTKLNSLPDWCWHLSDTQATGTLQWQQWPATQQARVQTSLLRSDQGMQLRYQVKLTPIAGRIVSWPMQFSSPVGELQWKSTLQSPGWTWKQTSPTQGEFRWEEPLEKPIELVATLPWKEAEALPLLTSTQEFTGTLVLDAGWQPGPASVGSLRHDKTNTAESRSLSYDAKTVLPGLERIKLEELTLIEPRLSTRLDGEIAISEYTATVPAHAETLYLRIQSRRDEPAVQVTAFTIDGMARPVSMEVPGLMVSASTTPQKMRVRYRSAITRQLLWSSWMPAVSAWSVNTSPQVICEVHTARSSAILSGDQTVQQEGDVQIVTMNAYGSLYWMPQHTLFSLAGLVFLAGCWLCRKRHMVGTWVTLAATVLLALQLPVSCWPISLAGGLAALLAWSSKLGAFALKGLIMLLLAVLLASSTLSAQQGTSSTVLVYLLPGETNKLEDARVMVPATLWKQMQKLSDANTIGPAQPWWVAQSHTEGELIGERLRFTSRWLVETIGNEPVDIPWLPAVAPSQIMLDDQPIQPTLLRGAFGIGQFSMRIAQPGRHRLTMTWEMPIQQLSSWQRVTIPLPGSPWQSLSMKGLPSTAVLQGTTASWAPVDDKQLLKAQVGLAREISLLWPVDALPGEDRSSVEVGVLWEHRLLQSTAHAVLTYHMNRPRDELLIALPRNLRVKSLNIVGDVPAIQSPHIRHWQVQSDGDKQRLVVQLQQPVSGTVHLLLELPWPRSDPADVVPLVGVEPIGIDRYTGFVAYLADGLLAQPQGKLDPVDTVDTTFARPWLPSLASLPETAFTKLGSLSSSAVKLKLQAIPLAPRLTSQTQIVLEPQDAIYRYQVEASHAQYPLAYLKAELAPGLTISEVQGATVASWQQTSAKPGEPSQLMIWLTAAQAGKPVICTLLARRPLEQPDAVTLRVPIYAVQWEGEAAAPATLSVVNQRTGIVSVHSASPELTPLVGPWPNSNQLAAWALPTKLPAGAALLLHQESQQQTPRAQASLERQGSEPYWKLTLTAPTGALLPTDIDLLVPGGRLEQLWQFEAGVPLVTRPSRAANGSLQWSIRFSQPTASITVKCQVKMDEAGKPLAPKVLFPAWPSLTID